MSDRAEFELAQITDRLLASRDRPKRQYLIERIGHIWSSGHRCCLFASEPMHHIHTAPTPESIAAVTSFENDPKVNVRVAVTFALRQKSVTDSVSAPALTRMLADAHPVIRVNAAHSLSFTARQSLAPGVLNKALADPTFSVRWIIAGSLAETEHSDRAWAVLRASCPCGNAALSYWLNHCYAFKDRFASDDLLISEILARIQTIPQTDYLRRTVATEFEQLLEQTA